MTLEEAIKQPRFVDDRQKASLNIIYTANWLQGLQQVFFKQHGITGQQYNILRILRGQMPGKISGTEIRGRMLDQNSDVSRLLDRLIIKKLIVKNQCPNDKRAADIMISQKGLDLLAEIDTKADAINGLLKNLTSEEALQLSDLLDKIRG